MDFPARQVRRAGALEAWRGEREGVDGQRLGVQVRRIRHGPQFARCQACFHPGRSTSDQWVRRARLKGGIPIKPAPPVTHIRCKSTLQVR